MTKKKRKKKKKEKKHAKDTKYCKVKDHCHYAGGYREVPFIVYVI